MPPIHSADSSAIQRSRRRRRFKSTEASDEETATWIADHPEDVSPRLVIECVEIGKCAALRAALEVTHWSVNGCFRPTGPADSDSHGSLMAIAGIKVWCLRLNPRAPEMLRTLVELGADPCGIPSTGGPYAPPSNPDRRAYASHALFSCLEAMSNKPEEWIDHIELFGPLARACRDPSAIQAVGRSLPYLFRSSHQAADLRSALGRRALAILLSNGLDLNIPDPVSGSTLVDAFLSSIYPDAIGALLDHGFQVRNHTFEIDAESDPQTPRPEVSFPEYLAARFPSRPDLVAKARALVMAQTLPNLLDQAGSQSEATHQAQRSPARHRPCLRL